MKTPFTYVDGALVADGVSLGDLASRYGTPLYVYDRGAIAERLDAIKTAFADLPTHMCYSVKANANLRLLKWLAGRGAGFDVVSGGELARALEVGAPADRVVFAGVGKTRRELEQAIDAAVWMVNLESVDEVRALAAVCRARGRTAVPVSLRICPDVDAQTHRHITTGREVDKFGITVDEFRELLVPLSTMDELQLVGLHMHIGSQVTDPGPYRAGIDVITGCAREARRHGHPIAWINAGGGFGIAYDGGSVPGPADYAAVLVPPVRELGAELVLELGRSVVGPAGCLLTEVQYTKRRDGRALVIVDAGMTDLLRPALYEAEHRIVPLRASSAPSTVTDVAGPICESSDFLGRGRDLPPLSPGDRLAVLDTGAYGMSMASHYNSHPRACEVWVTEEGRVEVIRRRETVGDLMAIEREALVAAESETGGSS